MFLPYIVDVPMERYPWANWSLIGLTVMLGLAFSLGLVGGSNFEHLEIDLHNVKEDDVIGKVIWVKEKTHAWALDPGRFSVLQLFTSLFVHADVFHLFGNMIFLFVFGNAVNAKIGHGLFLSSYCAFGTVSGLAWLLFGQPLPLIGASGAIMGMVGLCILCCFHATTCLCSSGSPCHGWTLFSIAGIWLVVLYMVGDLFGALFDGSGGIAYLCHLAGALAGIGVGLLLVGNNWVQSTEYEENLLELMGFREKVSRHERDRRAVKRIKKHQL